MEKKKNRRPVSDAYLNAKFTSYVPYNDIINCLKFWFHHKQKITIFITY